MNTRWRPPRLREALRPAAWRDAAVRAGWWASAALLVLVGGVLWAALHWLQPTPVKHVVLATGPERGAYEEFGRRYRPLLQRHGVTLELRRTEGSGENLKLLLDDQSGVMAAFVQGGVQGAAAPTDDDAAVPEPKLLSLGSVAREPLWVFYRADHVRRGAPPPRALADLAGWRLGVGPPGGGTGPLLRQLAAAGGLGEAGFVVHPTVVQGVLELVAGRLDALALVSAAEAPLVQYLLNSPGVALMGFTQAEAYSRRFPVLHGTALPRGLVDLAADQPPADIPLLAATASLVVRADLHPALMQLLLQAAHEAHGGSGWFHRPGEYPNATVTEWPLAAEAERFYRNGPPWLQHHLPFWLANFLDRMWIVLLPLLAALLPLTRVLPPLVAHRLRSRVFRWYANLRLLEQRIEAPDADLARLGEELERLDAQTERIGVPLSYANELYDLRSHIHLVRRRLQVLQAAPP